MAYKIGVFRDFIVVHVVHVCFEAQIVEVLFDFALDAFLGTCSPESAGVSQSF